MRITPKILLLVLFALLLTTVASPLLAAGDVPGEESLREVPDHVSDAVTTALVYDDGEADNGVRATAPNKFEYAQQFVAPSASSTLVAMSLCLQRQPADPANGTVGVRVYQDSGSGPGALIRSFIVNVFGVTTSLSGAFILVDLTGLNPQIVVPKNFYISVILDRQVNDFYQCLDYDGVAGNRPVYAKANNGAWFNYRNSQPSVKAFMIRAAVDSQGSTPGPGPGTCNAGSDAIFLLSGRFRVDACWRTSTNSGHAKLATVSGTGATMWFFNPNNPELFVKVRDACVNPFNRYWFFAAGLTNVEVTITVTDTQKAVSKTYMNPLNNAFDSVQDTDTFATCP